MNTPFLCYTCGWEGANRDRTWVKHPNGRGRIYTCPQCYAPTIRRMSSARIVKQNPEQLEHNLARYKVSRAVVMGELPSPRKCKCAVCANSADDYHHEDYSKPLDVVPLCRACHALRHRQMAVETVTV